METLRHIVVLVHIVGFAVLFGAWVVSAVGERRITRVMHGGMSIAAVSGLVLAAPWAVESLNYAKIGTKLVVLLVIGGVGLVLCVLTLITTVPAAIVTWRRLSRLPEGEPLRIECGFHARTGLEVRRLWWMPFAKFTWTWRSPAATVRLVRS